MRRSTTLALCLTLLAMAAPVTAGDDTQSIRESNRAYILANVPSYDPAETVEVHHDGTVDEMPASDALELALDRAGDTDLAALASQASHGLGAKNGVGDIWIVAFGATCEVTLLAPSPVPFLPVSTQLWLYGGTLAYGHSTADAYLISYWSMKGIHEASGDLYFGGDIDNFCVPGWWFFFPRMDGYTSEHPIPPADPLAPLAR